MPRRLLPPVAAFVVLVPAIALAGPDADVPLGFPLTDPAMPPDAIGVGHDDDAIAAYNTPTILFTNFDGAQLNGGCGNDSKNNCSTLGGQFGWEILPFTGDQSQRAAIVQSLREDLKDFGVTVTGERPPGSKNYAMVLVGNGKNGGQGFAGVAPYIDCGNSNPNVTSFALEYGGGTNGLATVINQEAAHTWGLEHVNDPTDNLHPTAGGFTDPKYNDVCNKIVQNTDLDPSNGQCNSVHTQFCSSGNQNSYQEMLLLFGGPVPDTVAPTVTFQVPSEGESFPCPASFQLTFTLSDDPSPQTMNMTLFLDGTEVASGLYVDTTLKFPVSGGIDPGAHTWRVEIEDESGNPGSGEVNFTIEDTPECAGTTSGGATTTTTGDPTDGGSTGGGSTGDLTSGTTGDGDTDGGGSSGGTTGPVTTTGPLPTTTGGESMDDASGCACAAARSGSAPLWALLVLVGVGRARKRSRG